MKKLLSAKADNPQAGLRLITSGPPGQYGLSIDKEMPGDQVVKHKDSKVLLVEHELANSLKGRTLDVEDTAGGKSFVVLKES